MKKKIFLMLTTGLVMSSLLAGCNFEMNGATKSYTYKVENDDKIKVICELNDGLKLSQDDSSFIIKNEDGEEVEGIFLDEKMYKTLLEEVYENEDDFDVKKKSYDALVEDEEINVFTFNQDEEDYYATFWIPESNTGIKLLSNDDDAKENLNTALDCLKFEVVSTEDDGIEDPAEDILKSLKDDDKDDKKDKDKNDKDKIDKDDKDKDDKDKDKEKDDEDDKNDKDDKQDVVDNKDGNVFTFINGDYFISENKGYVEQKAANDNYRAYLSPNQLNLLEVFVVEDYSEALETLGTNLKDAYGETPMYTVNKEGKYLTTRTDSALVFAFGTEGSNGKYDYIISLTTVDTENCMDIIYQFIDDLLASGLTEETERVKYEDTTSDYGNSDVGQGGSDKDVSGTDEVVSGAYWVKPSGYEETYNCEYFVSYDNDDYNVTLYYEVDEDIIEYKNNVPDNYYEKEYGDNMTTITMNIDGRNWFVFERISTGGYYYYHAIDGKECMYIEIDSYYGDQIPEKEIENLISDFVK